MLLNDRKAPSTTTRAETTKRPETRDETMARAIGPSDATHLRFVADDHQKTSPFRFRDLGAARLRLLADEIEDATEWKKVAVGLNNVLTEERLEAIEERRQYQRTISDLAAEVEALSDHAEKMADIVFQFTFDPADFGVEQASDLAVLLVGFSR
jgi:hypothetical protein